VTADGRITVRLDRRLAAEFAIAAELNAATVSQATRAALSAYVDKALASSFQESDGAAGSAAPSRPTLQESAGAREV
jgi:hypothetical protein